MQKNRSVRFLRNIFNSFQFLLEFKQKRKCILSNSGLVLSIYSGSKSQENWNIKSAMTVHFRQFAGNLRIKTSKKFKFYNENHNGILLWIKSGHSQKKIMNSLSVSEFQVQESKRGLFSFLKSCKNMSLVKVNLEKSPKCELSVICR